MVRARSKTAENCRTPRRWRVVQRPVARFWNRGGYP
jgi:hypothetical protein